MTGKIDNQSAYVLEWAEGRSRVECNSSDWADISNRKCTHQLVLENSVWEKCVPEFSALISCGASRAKACRNTNSRAVLSSRKGQKIDPLFLYFFHIWKKKMCLQCHCCLHLGVSFSFLRPPGDSEGGTSVCLFCSFLLNLLNSKEAKFLMFQKLCVWSDDIGCNWRRVLRRAIL